MSSVEDMFPGVQGSVRREKIRERYGINAEEVGGDRILPCKLDGNGHPDVNKKIIERHPLNDRRYKELENQYAKRMLTDGYDNEDAGAISLVATDSSRKSWLAIGGATRCQAFLNAYAIQPDNLQLDAFIKAGGYKASYYKESMPDVVVHWLVEELNVRNGLGVTNTLMQKVLSVPRYVAAFNAANEGKDPKERLAPGTTEYVEAQWEYVQAATPIYGSQIEWKKVHVLHGTLSNNSVDEDGKSMTLLGYMKEYYESHVDPLGMQQVEQSRNIVKYMNDLLSRIVPSRSAAGKGRCAKYPELAAQAIKLSLVSNDGIPRVHVQDAHLGRVNDTFTYADSGEGAEADEPLKKKQKKKQVQGSESSSGKQGLNRLDVIEDAIKDMLKKLKQRSISPKLATINVCRRRLLEFVFRGATMDVRITGKEGKEDKKTLKTLDQAVSHFVQVCMNVHTAELEAHYPVDVENHADAAEDASHEEGGVPSPAFILSVPIEVIKHVSDHAPFSIIRPNLGTNMVRRLRPNIFVELKNNKSRICAEVARIEKAPSANALLDNLLANGVVPGHIAPRALERPSVEAWLKSSGLEGGRELVAFEVVLLTEAPEANTNEAMPDENKRVLARRPSDAVDLCDPAMRQKWKEINSQFQKHSMEVSRYTTFGKAAVDMLRGGVNMSPRDALTSTMNVTLECLPRELDYIADLEGASIKSSLTELRQQFAWKLAVMTVDQSLYAMVNECFGKFGVIMEEYQFPKYQLDVESFVNDLLQAQRREASEAEEMEKTRIAAREQELSSLKAKLEETSQSLAKATAPAPRRSSARNATLLSESFQQLFQPSTCQHSNKPSSSVAEPSEGQPATGQQDSESTEDHAIVPAEPGHGDPSVEFGQFELTVNDGFFDPQSKATRQKVISTLASSSLDGWLISEVVRADLESKLEEQPDGTYKAKVDIDQGDLVIPFVGALCSWTTSKFKIPCNGSWLDGTARARSFPNAWRGVRTVDKEADANMDIIRMLAPSVTIKVTSTREVSLSPFEAPAFKNSKHILAGEVLATTAKWYAEDVKDSNVAAQMETKAQAKRKIESGADTKSKVGKKGDDGAGSV